MTVYLDVREDSEVAQGMLPGAIHIPLGQLARRISELPRDQKIVAYCRSGHRSGQAASFLKNLGFEAVNGGGYLDLI